MIYNAKYILPGLLAYARASGRPLRDVLPSRLALSGKFVAVMSAMSPGGVLMDGDNSNDRFTGDTIAILANGVDRRYPAGHRDLLDRVADVGLLASEVPPGAVPTRHRHGTVCR